MSEWYKDWFASNEYLELYRHRDDKDAEKLCELISESVELNNSTHILDAACGNGRHSNIFALKGCRVTAFDLSRNLLSVAQKRTRTLALNVDYCRCDLRTLPFKPFSFDLITSLFTSFGYFEHDSDNFLVFDNAFMLLKPGGYFAFDYFNTVFLGENLKKESVDHFNGKVLIQKRSINGKRVIKHITIKNGTQESKFKESVKLYDNKEIIQALEARGFIIEKIYGDYQKNSFCKECSPRLIIIARKR